MGAVLVRLKTRVVTGYRNSNTTRQLWGQMASNKQFQRGFAFAVTATTLGALALLNTAVPATFPELLTLTLAAIITNLAGRFVVPLRSTDDKNQATTVSLRFVVTLFLITTQRDWDCIWIVAAAALPEFRKSSPYHERRLFNLAFSVVATALSVVTARFAQQTPLPTYPLVVATTLAVAIVYHLTHVTLISAAMAVHSDQPFVRNFRFLYQTVFGYVAGAAVVAAGRLTLAINPNPVALLPIAALATPIGIIILREQTLRRERDDEHARRLRESQSYIAELEQRRSELQQRHAEIEEMYASTVEAFALAIDAKDRYTQEHIQRVKKVAVAIAQQLGLAGDQLRAIEVGAALHDIGKIAIPEHILNKPGRLNADEFDVIKRHAEMGARILQPVHFPYPVMGVVRSHHEKWDGTGYPDALAGEDIPLGGRILAVADVYDALTSDRPYRESWDHERAADYLTQQSGIHFDPTVVDAFHAAMALDPGLKALISASTSEKPSMGNEINRAAFEYRAVYEISNVLTEEHNVAGIARNVTDTIRQLYDATTCLILLSDGTTLAVAHCSGANQGHFDGAKVDQWNGPTADTFLSGQGRLGNYDSADLLLTAATDNWTPLKSCTVAPLRTEDGSILGTINLYSSSDARFQADDLRILEALTSLAAHGIENAIEKEDKKQTRGTDLLTELPNRERFSEILAHTRQHAHPSQSWTLVLLDMVRLRKINQTYGYETGNAILKAIAPTLKPALPEGTVVARLESDHFAVLIPNSSPQPNQDWETTIRTNLTTIEPLRFASGGRQTLDTRTGVAHWPSECGDPSAWMCIAENRLELSRTTSTAIPAAA